MSCNGIKLPDDIGGYQHLEPDVVAIWDDIMVRHGIPLAFVGDRIVLGTVEQIETCFHVNLYRKIPVAKQGECNAQPSEAAVRKGRPIATGVLDYFPDALLAVAELSRVGNEQHNPGKPLHWDRSKSADESDALIRHFMERGTFDTDGILHDTKVAWRALAMLQKRLEAIKAESK
jgi:hypothetical protein